MCASMAKGRPANEQYPHTVSAAKSGGDITNTVARLMSMLEPAMLLLMGLVTGFIVIAMLSAVFSVNQMNF